MRRKKPFIRVMLEELPRFVFAMVVAGIGAYAAYHFATNYLAELARQTVAP